MSRPATPLPKGMVEEHWDNVFIEFCGGMRYNNYNGISDLKLQNRLNYSLKLDYRWFLHIAGGQATAEDSQ